MPYSIAHIDPALILHLQEKIHEWGENELSNLPPAPPEEWLALALALEQEASAIRQRVRSIGQAI
jgi:hypothetical protein